VNGALPAEWTKLRTARATAWLPVAAVVLTVGLGAAVSATAAPGTTACAGGCDPARLSLSGVYLGQAAVVALAVLAVTGEYRSGLIATTLTALPRRLTVFTAKAVAVTAAVLAVGGLGVAGSLAASRILLSGSGLTVSLADGAVLRAAVGTVCYLVLVGLLSLGLATALRSSAAALTVVLGLLYLAPIAARLVADERWHARIERYSPMNAGLAVQATRDLGGLPVGPWAGLAVLAGWAAAALALGAAAFLVRDA
jgi:ABC-2 type transport system permease protein